MKPIWLTLKGINSFREEQTIDFASLTSQGFFGIFGPTGSGKSTILDAMTLALYARLPRSTKNFININETSAYVSFRFSITTTQTEEYIVERSFRYHKNNQTSSCRNISGKLLKVNGEEREILADRPTEVTSECISLLGLGADDFMRTVVLPQGQFSEFLKLKNAERRSMLQRIFHLEEYGVELTSKINQAKYKQNLFISQLEGEIKPYSSAGKEALEALNQNLAALSETMEKKQEEFHHLQDQYEKAREIHNLTEELIPLKQQAKDLEEYTPVIASLQNRLDTGIRANRIHPYFLQKKSASSSLAQAAKEVKRAQDESVHWEETLSSSRAAYETLINEYTAFSDSYPEKRQTLITARDIKERIEALKEKQQTVQTLFLKTGQKLAAVKEEEQAQKKALLAKDQKIGELQEELSRFQLDPTLKSLLESGKELEEKYKRSEEDCRKLFQKATDYRKHYHNSDQKMDELLSQLSFHYKNCRLRLSELHAALANLQEHYRKTEARLEQLQDEKDQDAKEYWVRLFQESLEEEKPCPVCGSIHHPLLATNLSKECAAADIAPASNEETIANLKKQLTSLENEINEQRLLIHTLDSAISELKSLLPSSVTEEAEPDNPVKHPEVKRDIPFLCSAAGKLRNEFHQLSGIRKQQEEQYQAIREEYGEVFKHYKKCRETLLQFQETHGFHASASVSVPVSASSPAEEIYPFTLKQREYEEQEKKYHSLLEQRSLLQNERQKLSDDSQDLNAQIQTLTADYLARETEQKHLENSMKEEYKNFPPGLSINTDCQKELHLLELQKQQWQDKKEEQTKGLQSLEEKLTSAQHDFISKKAMKDNWEKQYKEAAAILERELAKENFSPEENLETRILSKEKEAELTRQIKEFDAKQNQLKERISYLESKLSGNCQTQEEWLSIKENYDNLSNELKGLNNQYILLERDIEKMESDLKAKEALQTSLDQAVHKMDIIQELEKLFKGNAFIEYVSLTKLNYIAREASSTLLHISNGKYSLEVNDQTEFVIRDHHNGGMTRPCDTLSGGETFITSLCLALALSSTLQLNGTTPLELFFLDEGFGSLDDELLDVVMDSLERLQTRKRSIGIISHVESIQCRVPRKLIVTPADTKKNGSKVRLEFS